MITLQERVHNSPPPSDWNLNKLHRVFRVRKGYKNIGMMEDNLLSLSYGRIINKDIDTADGLLPENFETYQIVEPGNIVMRLTDLQNDKRSLRQGLVKERGIITSAYDALELERGHDPRFWAYALLALDLAKYYYSLGAGVRQSIKFADFPNDWIATPDENNQKTIADFLGRETARIDQLIEKKQRLVELLAEKIESEIWQAISRDCGSKQGGAVNHPWSTDLPDAWTLAKISHFASVGNGSTPSRDNSAFWTNEGMPWLNSGAIHQRHVNTSQYFVTEDALQNCHLPIVQPDTVLVAITGQGKTRGTAAICKIKATISQHLAYIRIRRTSEVLPDYLLLALRAAYKFLREQSAGVGSTRAALTCDYLKSLSIPTPPVSTQRCLVEKIEKIEKICSDCSQTTELSIDRLREFRSALITGAVTGQIDVTTWGKFGNTDRGLDQIEEDLALREVRA